MDTIVTPVTVITLDSTRIVHSIKADLVARYFPPVVRLVQYDMSLPVIAVSLMQNGQTYILPSGAAANIRVHKPDATYVYNPALGCDSTRNIVYFEVTQAMAAANGDGLAIVEIVVDGDIAGTSLITLHFEENPVPEDAIESSDEWETIYELGERIIASTVTPVSTAAGMTDHNVVYLYTGTESGWNQGHMYYYNGTTWVDAGIAVTDTTLSVAGLAADAKKTGDEIEDLKDGLDAVTDKINATLITDTASGAIASFSDGAAMPVKSLTVDIEPVQSGSGDPSPTNVRPISGHTSAVVTRCGKNVLPVTAHTQTVNGVTFTVNTDGSIAVNGTANANTAFILNTITLKSGTYIASKGFASTTLLLNVYDNDARTNIASVRDNEVQFTSTGHSLNVLVYCYSGTSYNTIVYPMLRFSTETDSTFEPYTADTYTIDLDGTRYGGTLNVETGVLTVDRQIVDLGTLTWTYQSANSRYYATLNGRRLESSDSDVPDMICTTYKCISVNDFNNNGMDYAIRGNTSSNTIFIRDTRYTDATTLTDALSGVQLCYELAQPVTVQLTAQDDITTVLGQNNIWADTGDVEVEYRADTKLYIEKLTAPTEDDMIADHAISANTFFMIGNTLYRATTAIASGATITVGTNATRLSLSEALNTLS